MALTAKLQARQTQNLTMTPQLVQSIKLLRMNHAELIKYIEEEMERNPLLEVAEPDAGERRSQTSDNDGKREDSAHASEVSLELDTSRHSLEESLGTSLENAFDWESSGQETSPYSPSPPSASQTGTDFSVGSEDAADLEAFIAGELTLKDHLQEQLALCRCDVLVRQAANEIIDNLDEDGYCRRPLPEMAKERDLDFSVFEEALKLLQGLDPTGIAARDLAECLSLQLKERNRLDPAMVALLENLDLLAQRDYKALCRICGIDLDDLLDMVDEIKALDPRPARAFDHSPIQNVAPDVLVTERADGGFGIELNLETMPRLLVNQTYRSEVRRNARGEQEKAFFTDCLQNATWLIRSLEQRAQTILKVMTEIVRHQDGFFAYGVTHLKPLSLKQVAEATGLHESTVSRVTSNKYVLTNRGLFELKFFFTASINATEGDEAHSAEAVRQRIRHLIDHESADTVLSDDAIVAALKSEGIDIARRTVAKYREVMNIASSVQRRREKKAILSRA